jgi:hypothetical protein
VSYVLTCPQYFIDLLFEAMMYEAFFGEVD